MDNALVVRIGAFVGVLAAMAIWELASPRRPRRTGYRRWPHNLGLMLIDVAALRIVAPGAAVGVAVLAQSEGWGLLNAVSLPRWAAIAAGVVALDFAIYIQHVLFHAVPALWRLHRVHHSDTEIDVTTGVRFHPFEILISTGIKCAAVAALGVPVLAVLAFEVILNAAAMFNHANVRLPAQLDRLLRWLVVTPDMHRIHHSLDPREQSSNYGFNLSWWDRLLRTYRAQPALDTVSMPIGVADVAGVDALRLDRLLVQPLLSRTDARRSYER